MLGADEAVDSSLGTVTGTGAPATIFSPESSECRVANPNIWIFKTWESEV